MLLLGFFLGMGAAAQVEVALKTKKEEAADIIFRTCVKSAVRKLGIKGDVYTRRDRRNWYTV